VALKEIIIEQLKSIWSENKAKGLLAQVKFQQFLVRGELTGLHKKYYSGGWILAPKDNAYFKYRYAFFIHGEIIPNINNLCELEEVMDEASANNFKRIAGYLNKAGIGVMYAIPLGNGIKNIENIEWNIYNYNLEEERLQQIDSENFFSNWGNRGRPSRSRGWSRETEGSYLSLDEDILLALYLNEHFYTEYLKRKLHIPISDPYDVDGFFIVHTSGKVIPIEIKEKFPAGENQNKFFGIDAGRVLMLLRLCLPNDSNALYIIREVDDSPQRRFVAWKYISLSDIIMTSGWNLQRGGTGMGGQETQTIRLPYDEFKALTKEVLKDSYLDKIGDLPKEIKDKVQQFLSDRISKFGW